MLNIALIGCGRIGRMHADLIERHSQSRLAAVFDPVSDAAEAVAGPVVALGTAHAAKFPAAVEAACAVSPALPDRMASNPL